MGLAIFAHLPLTLAGRILSNTAYLQDPTNNERAEGPSIEDDTVAHHSPARIERINPYGQFRFGIAEVVERQRHPLDDA